MNDDRLHTILEFLGDQSNVCPHYQDGGRVRKAQEMRDLLERFLADQPEKFVGAHVEDGVEVPFELRSIDFGVAQHWDRREHRLVRRPSGMITVEVRQMIEFAHLGEPARIERLRGYKRFSIELLRPGLYRKPKEEPEPDGP